MLKELAEYNAEKIVESEKSAREKTEDIQKTMKKLLSENSVNPDLLNYFTQYGHDIMASELGPDVADKYWNKVVDWLELGIKEMLKVPMQDRTELWYTAGSILVAAAHRQAFIESGAAQEALETGLDMGKKTKQTLEKTDVKNLEKNGRYNVADFVKEKRKK